MKRWTLLHLVHRVSQDLSVAGKQLGIHEGQRSNLFFEAIRIIKEMRDATSDKFPRFAVWENVPGAFSSNKGEDFRAVLRAFAEIGEKGSEVSVPMPTKGKWLPAGTVVGNGWSLAWRVYDAQFWGVPQRRKRIYLIADFGSERAGEILFKPEGVSGHPEPGGEKGKGTSGDAEGSVGRSCITFKERAGCPGGGKGILIQNDKSATLATNTDQSVCFALDSTYSNAMKSSNPNSGFHEETVTKTLDTNPDPTCNQGGNVIVEPAAFMGGQGAKARSIAYCDDGSTPTIKSAPSGGNTVPDVVYPINTMVATRGGKDDMRTCFGVGEKNDPQFTLSAAHEHAVCYANGCDLYNGKLTGEIAPTLGANSCTSANHAGPSVCYAMEGNTVDRSAKQNGIGISQDISPSLNTQDRHAVAYGIDQQGGKGNAGFQKDVMPTLCSDSHGTPHAVCYPDKARSLCARHDSSPCVDRGQNIVCYGVDCRNACLDEEKTHTLQAKPGGGTSLNCTPSVLYSQAGYAGYAEGTGVLKASGEDAGGGRSASSLSVFPIENHPADSRVGIAEEDICQTLTSRMGTGGGNVPMILEVRDE